MTFKSVSFVCDSPLTRDLKMKVANIIAEIIYVGKEGWQG